MDHLGIRKESSGYKNKISYTIQGKLIDLYGANGYKSIMQTMTKISEKTEDETIRNFRIIFRVIIRGFWKIIKIKNFGSNQNENRHHMNREHPSREENKERMHENINCR